MDIHLVPPHNHQVNVAECAIATFKDHFIVGLAIVARNCPLQLWDEFLHQVELTLNLLRSHNIACTTQTLSSMDRAIKLLTQLTQVPNLTSFFYYAHAVDPTILMVLSAIASQQALPTEDMPNRVNQFLDYMATHPNAKIQHCASDMILNVRSDALYLSAPHVQSPAGGYFFLSSTPRDGSPFKLTALFTSPAQFSNLWRPLQMKQSLAHSSLMHKRPKSSGLSLKNLVIHNHQLPYTLTTPLLLALLTTPSNINIHKLWK